MKNQLITLTLAEIPKEIRGKMFKYTSDRRKSHPHYFTSTVPELITIEEKEEILDKRNIKISILGYIPYIIVIKCQMEVEDIFRQNEILSWEEKLYNRSYEIISDYEGNKEFSEVYSIFTVEKYEGEPEQFYKYAPQIAALLKSESLVLDKKEIEYTLSSQIKYAEHDLAIIDWDGAFLFDKEGDFSLPIELLILANLQLLRHRILDKRLDEQLKELGNLIKNLNVEKRKWFNKNERIRDMAKDILERRITWITAFESLERDIKLIGEWYSARFYDLASKKLKIESWRNQIKEKLDFLEGIYESLVDNFSISAKEKAEWIELIGFFILQIGWFVLIILEFIYFTR